MTFFVYDVSWQGFWRPRRAESSAAPAQTAIHPPRGGRSARSDRNPPVSGGGSGSVGWGARLSPPPLLGLLHAPSLTGPLNFDLRRFLPPSFPSLAHPSYPMLACARLRARRCKRAADPHLGSARRHIPRAALAKSRTSAPHCERLDHPSDGEYPRPACHSLHPRIGLAGYVPTSRVPQTLRPPVWA